MPTKRSTLSIVDHTFGFGKYKGAEFAIVRLVTSDEADLEETGPMYRVRIESGDYIGDEVDIFEDEGFTYSNDEVAAFEEGTKSCHE